MVLHKFDIAILSNLFARSNGFFEDNGKSGRNTWQHCAWLSWSWIHSDTIFTSMFHLWMLVVDDTLFVHFVASCIVGHRCDSTIRNKCCMRVFIVMGHFTWTIRWHSSKSSSFGNFQWNLLHSLLVLFRFHCQIVAVILVSNEIFQHFSLEFIIREFCLFFRFRSLSVIQELHCSHTWTESQAVPHWVVLCSQFSRPQAMPFSKWCFVKLWAIHQCKWLHLHLQCSVFWMWFSVGQLFLVFIFLARK